MSGNVHINDYTPQVLAEIGKKVFTFIQEEFVDLAVEIAKEKTPHVTGNNASRIQGRHRGFRGGVFHWRIFTESNYGAYLELGTQRMPARPYMAPAILESAERIKAMKLS